MLNRLLLTCVLACAAACGDDDELPEECAAIAEACHAVDPGSGPIHDCHENAEGEWDRAECTANSASCMTLCAAAARPDGGGGS